MLRKDGRSGMWFTVAIVLLHLFAFLLALHFKRIYMGDTYEYVYEAMNIKDNFFFYSGCPSMPVMPEYMTLRPPGYPLFLAVIYLFTQSGWWVLVVQNVLSVFNVLYLRRILFRLGYRDKYDWLFLLFIITWPAQFIFANTLAPDLLLQSCVLLYFGHMVYLYKRRAVQQALLASIWLVAGMMVKPIVYPLCYLHIVLLVGFAVYIKRDKLSLVSTAFIPLCFLLLYNAWNYERTGKFHFSSILPINALYYNCYLFYGDKYGSEKAHAFSKEEHAKIDAMPGFGQRYDYAIARSEGILKDNFMAYSVFHLKHCLRFFIEPGKGEIDLFTGRLTYGGLYKDSDAGFYATVKMKGMSGVWDYVRQNPSMPLVLLVLLFNLIKVLGLVFFMCTRSIPFYGRLFTMFILCYFAGMTGPIANTRYFLPVALIVAGAAAMGFGGRIYKKSESQTV